MKAFEDVASANIAIDLNASATATFTLADYGLGFTGSASADLGIDVTFDADADLFGLFNESKELTLFQKDWTVWSVSVVSSVLTE